MEFLLLVIILSILCFAYFLPSIIAFFRHHSYRSPIFILNIFAFTGFVWIVILVWAVMPKDDIINN